MSWRRDGEREENQRPELIASRSSMVRMGSSMVCLMGDWCTAHCRVRDPGETTGSVPWGTAPPFSRLLVGRRLFCEESGDTDSCVRVMQVLHEMIALAGEVTAEAGLLRVVHQLLDAGQCVGRARVQVLCHRGGFPK